MVGRLWPVWPRLPALLQTRDGALKIGGLAFLGTLLVVLANGWALHDYEASSALWAILIPLGILIVVVGLPALLPGEYHRRRLLLGAAVYAVVGALVGLMVSQVSDTDGSRLCSSAEAVIAGLAWAVVPFLWMLQAMHDGLGWY